jgi:tetratricopeptide (TPR) repeat protein
MIDSPYQRIFDKGVQQFKGKQSDAAIQSFSDAIALKPERFAPYLNRGTIYLQLNLLSQALSDFNRSIELDPRDPTGYFNRAIVRLKENRPSEALSDLYITLSCLYLQRGESTREIKFLTKAISLVENNVHAYLERGKLYKIKGNNVLAENDFSGAIELDGQNMEAFALRGSLYRDMKQDEASQRDTKVVLALSKEGKKKPLALNPQLKPMNDAQINQEILTKLKEIAEMRNALAAVRVDIGGERDRSERLIQ